MTNTFGRLFRITTFGESHGAGLGVVVDGCPPGLAFDGAFLQAELDRRKPGQSALTTQRKEADQYEVVSGVFEGKTTGTPLALVVRNTDARPRDYAHVKDIYRPSHADYTYAAKYGVRDYRGGGRASARETANWVAAGAVAKMLLRPLQIAPLAWVCAVGEAEIPAEELWADWPPEAVEASPTRCPHPPTAESIESIIREARKAGDTAGGILACRVRNVPPGWGAPVFGKLHADLAFAMTTINAARGFEIGAGFAAARMRGSEHNDPFYLDELQRARARTNHSGGVQGGISNGEDICFRVPFKPLATLMQPQETIDRDGNPAVAEGRGRHDPCALPRAVPIAEAMTALVLADHYLLAKAQKP